MKNKKAALALPWELIIGWALLLLFAFFVFLYYGTIREMINNIIKSIFK